MKVVAIVQARLGSTRLPNKVLKRIEETTIIELLLKRLKKSAEIDEIIIAIPDTQQNKELKVYLESLSFKVFEGDEHDVLSRFYQSAKAAGADAVVRITGDCPLVDAYLVDSLIRKFRNSKFDYISNVSPATFPDGLDIEVFSSNALNDAWLNANSKFEREHVTPYIRNELKFTKYNVEYSEDLSQLRWTLDEAADLDFITHVFKQFAPDIYFNWEQVLAYVRSQGELLPNNSHLKRNEGMTISSGQKLWRRAKQIIPGGNMLLSKRTEMFLPEQWPSYFSKSKGCKVWDLDGNEYIDMSIMGIGTNTLGYGHPEVDDAVRGVIDKGNMSTLNCPEEVYLAEKLIELNPWAHMVKLARSGGEANAIAIRIARAATGKDRVAICGYHGWHDWYLSANLGDEKNLAGHLLPGLNPQGVPQNLRGTIFPFNYNDIEALEEIVNTKDIGVIKMEVSRNKGPEDGFLEKVRALATKKGIVLIFDECTSGFRQTNGGLYKLYGVEPDMALFGKALGNGYAITAIVGKKDIMEAAQSTFISSTFWTERIGPTAALATLEVMKREKSWEKITLTGRKITEGWMSLAKQYNLSISTSGLPALTSFAFNSENALAYKTLVSQEMLSKGYLAGTAVYVCTEHTDEVVGEYFRNLKDVFSLIAECEHGNKKIDELLKGPICHAGFKRLN